MSPKIIKPLSLVDSTYRFRWEITKEEFDNCELPDRIQSSIFSIEINGEVTEWRIRLYPKGKHEKDKNVASFYLKSVKSGEETYKVRFQFGIETAIGFWPHDLVNMIYSRGAYGDNPTVGYTRSFNNHGSTKTRGGFNEEDLGSTWGYPLCTSEDFSKRFVDNKLTVVVSFMIYAEGDRYRKRMKVADNFVDDIREMSSLENLSDFTIISNGVRFPCFRLILAARSKYFEALFRNEPQKKEVDMDESPEIVKTMLDFMCKGLTPNDLEDKAMDLMLVSDMYGLDLLTEACQSSLVDNLSPDNAVQTLIMIDKVKHTSKLEYRQKVLIYVKKEADQVVKAKDWKQFVQTYPDLVTEIVLIKS